MLAERNGADATPETDALKAALPAPQMPRPAVVTVVPSSQRPGRQARPSLASSRPWLYSFSFPTKTARDVPAARSSSVSDRRLLCAR